MRPHPSLLFLCVAPLAACALQPVKTAGDTTRANLGGAVTAPLSDFNLVRSKIPLVLVEASNDPYRRPDPDGCPGISIQLDRLNEALGPDLDIHKKPMDRTDRSAAFAADSAIHAVKDMTEGWIPMKSWVRFMSGAEQHSKAVASAISAGQVRRAYLKGLAQSEGCTALAPHATHLFPAPPVTPSSVTQTASH